MSRKLLALALTCFTALAVACSGDDEPSATATATRPASASTVVATQSAPTSAPATATRPAASATVTTPAATATPQTNFPPIEGTIDPLGFGDTIPVTIKSNPDPITGAALLRAVRVGAHPEQGGWDRIVFEFADTLPAGEIKYVDSASQCGSGAPVSIPGATAILEVTFQPANAHTDAGQATTPRQIAGPGGVILQAQSICDFEANVGWAVGVKSKQRFKVTRLSSPTRLVIDIKQ